MKDKPVFSRTFNIQHSTFNIQHFVSPVIGVITTERLFLAFVALFLLLWAVVYATLPAVRHIGQMLAWLVARSARATRVVSTTRERYKDYLPVVAILVAGALLTAWAGDAFIDLAEMVHAKSSALEQADKRVHDRIAGERSPGATIFFTTMTNIGGPAGVTAILAAVSIVLAFRRRWRWLVYLVVTAGGGALLDLELKRYFARARPDVAEMLRVANGYSFPSGHAMGSAVGFGLLAYLTFRAIRSWPAKTALIAFLYTLVAAVALSRVYLGVHWISDVLAGITAGTVWVTTTTVAYETMRRIRSVRSQTNANRLSNPTDVGRTL
jgi:Membrane-associated phospholipid phosphatase